MFVLRAGMYALRTYLFFLSLPCASLRPNYHFWHVCVYVCVFFPFILDIKFVGRTSRGHTGGRSHRIFHPPSFCGACLNFSREKDSAIPFPRRPWSRILCTNDLIVLHINVYPSLLFLLFLFCYSFYGLNIVKNTTITHNRPSMWRVSLSIYIIIKLQTAGNSSMLSLLSSRQQIEYHRV